MAETTVLRKSDMQSLAGKLEKFAHELPEQEKNVLGWILARAEAASDVELLRVATGIRRGRADRSAVSAACRISRL